jgi:hypothetical protein
VKRAVEIAVATAVVSAQRFPLASGVTLT